MKDISIGIYHKDHQYGKRLMEYLNHQKDFPMTASFTSDEEMFFKQEQEGDFECLVLAEETDYHGDISVCKEYGSFEWVDLFWNAAIWTL